LHASAQHARGGAAVPCARAALAKLATSKTERALAGQRPEAVFPCFLQSAMGPLGKVINLEGVSPNLAGNLVFIAGAWRSIPSRSVLMPTKSPSKLPFIHSAKFFYPILAGVITTSAGVGGYAMKLERDGVILENQRKCNEEREQSRREVAAKDAEIGRLKEEHAKGQQPLVDRMPQQLNWQWAGENWFGYLRQIDDKGAVRLTVKQCNKAVPSEKWPILFEGLGTAIPDQGSFKIQLAIKDQRSGERRLERLEGKLQPVRAYWDKDLHYYYSDRPQDPESGDFILVEAAPR